MLDAPPGTGIIKLALLALHTGTLRTEYALQFQASVKPMTLPLELV
jgi:hypothetical protein